MIAMPERCSQPKATRRRENPHRLGCSRVVVHVFSKLIYNQVHEDGRTDRSISPILKSQDQRHGALRVSVSTGTELCSAYRAQIFADGECMACPSVFYLG